MMRPNFRKVLETAIEGGVQYGYSRAHKHIENPSEGAIIDSIVEQVMNSLDEWFDFDDGN
jgi:pyruvate-formate lyase